MSLTRDDDGFLAGIDDAPVFPEFQQSFPCSIASNSTTSTITYKSPQHTPSLVPPTASLRFNIRAASKFDILHKHLSLSLRTRHPL
jgi:hypothetical protein